VDFSKIYEAISEAVEKNILAKITLSKPVNTGQELRNVFIRPVIIKGKLYYSILYRYKTKDETFNYNPEELLSQVKHFFGALFYNMHVFMLDRDLELRLSRKGTIQTREAPPSFDRLPDLSHDRKKERFIQTRGNVYLQELGVTGKDGAVLPGKGDKFRQIQKYIEILDGLISKITKEQDNVLHITDMGSGKGYLTFALYDHLVNGRDLAVKLTGVEARGELVEDCNRIAGLTGFTGLEFRQGSILDYKPGRMDVLIALHACDTATDDAIFQGIRNNASLIVCAPCCHKQVRKDMNTQASGIPVVRYGILLERQAELLTDNIRALLMQAYGYESQVFEFVSTEHTPKNLMITGVKTEKSVDTKNIFNEIDVLKKQYGIRNHYLENLLKSL